jgi:hypothetical protein
MADGARFTSRDSVLTPTPPRTSSPAAGSTLPWVVWLLMSMGAFMLSPSEADTPVERPDSGLCNRLCRRGLRGHSHTRRYGEASLTIRLTANDAQPSTSGGIAAETDGALHAGAIIPEGGRKAMQIIATGFLIFPTGRSIINEEKGRESAIRRLFLIHEEVQYEAEIAHLRHSRFVALRDDKKAQDVPREGHLQRRMKAESRQDYVADFRIDITPLRSTRSSHT